MVALVVLVVLVVVVLVVLVTRVVRPAAEVVVGKVAVVTGVVRPAAVVLVVVVVSGRAAAMRAGYLYPLAQTKYELSCILSDIRPQVSILKKYNQTLRSPL